MKRKKDYLTIVQQVQEHLHQYQRKLGNFLGKLSWLLQLNWNIAKLSWELLWCIHNFGIWLFWLQQEQKTQCIKRKKKDTLGLLGKDQLFTKKLSIKEDLKKKKRETWSEACYAKRNEREGFFLFFEPFYCIGNSFRGVLSIRKHNWACNKGCWIINLSDRQFEGLSSAFF